tara:strand:+ start:1611 stop:2582 length:972 start_codon:yes stop_codon:yes gene_type:complete
MHEHERIGKFLPLMQSLYNTAQEKLGFKPHVKIVILKDSGNMSNPLGKTAHYSPTEKKIGLYTQGRHIKDILRSLSHELVHHNQNCRGDFGEGNETMQGYAQEDGHLREMEREAYECGNMIFRDWEDNLKDKGARPLFTSTSQYVPAPTSDVVSSALFEGDKMKKNLKESRLREIIRGVIQEMFNDDLTEGDMVNGSEADTAASMEARASEENAEKGQTQSIDETNDDKRLSEDSEGEETEHYGEDEGEDHKEEEGMEDHVEAIEHHLGKLKDDMGYDEDHEDRDEEGDHFRESFFPKGRSIREKARLELNEALMKRWTKIIK